MKRDIFKDLEHWARSEIRVPLVIKGARQVGKSWCVREFGKTFENFVEINFEKHKELKSAFCGDVDVQALLQKLSLYKNIPIIPGKTLLFFDEIQECPEAILYLRYFKEDKPDLHIIAAGSLIEFALEKVGMPVGRVDYLYLTPLSFGEFLSAAGREDLRKQSLNSENNSVLDQLLKEYLRNYFWLGGMPEVVDTWIKHQNIEQCQQIQDRIIAAYEDDFPKYAKRNQIEHVEKLFNNIPIQLGNKFVYTRVDDSIRSANLKSALCLLERAGIAHVSYYSSSQHVPLKARKNEKFFKVFFLDVGLTQRMLGMLHQSWIIQSIKVENLGGLAEQFVAQELVSYGSKKTKKELFYWLRESKNAKAEIDFLVEKGSDIFPIEVKSGKTGRLKSLQYYLNTHPDVRFGVKISENPYYETDRILEIPLYSIEAWLTS
ncbi:MAG: ATP-binding protein [Gammaproteobacteria bacterium]